MGRGSNLMRVDFRGSGLKPKQPESHQFDTLDKPTHFMP
jgi:hypothetical protein